MKTIVEKYNQNRNYLRHGDIILYHGNSLMAKLIQKVDKCYYNHIGLILKFGGRFYTVDMWYSGVLNGKLSIVPLSERIKDFEDFCIMRPEFNSNQIDLSVDHTLRYLDFGVKYDRLKLIKILLIKKFNLSLKIDHKNKFICSEFIQKYTDYFDSTYTLLTDITPSDFIRYINNNYKLMLYHPVI